MSILYSDQKLICESKYTKIFRAIRKSESSFIILKALKPETAPPKEYSKIQNEYNILQKLNTPRVVKTIGFDKINSILFLEDIKGISLLEATASNENLEHLLKLAIEMARGLGDIHHQHVIHKDINPNNILVNETQNIKYIDFGISSLLTKETQHITNLSSIEGTLAYISPEQTGRVNHPIDYRSDIYSLGVTLYQIFTKQLPYKDENALDLIHAHIARVPVSPNQINSKIPKALSDIIMKCISKIPEERYKSAFGLKTDLTKCLNQLVSRQNIESFELAQADVIDHFELPSKLYGRKKEINYALASYKRVQQGKMEALLIEGVGGVGKTSLISEIEKLITIEKGRFVKAEFIQFKKHVPYHGLIEVLKNLVSDLLVKDEATLAAWRSRILSAVGNAGQLLIDIVPQLKLIIGDQPPVPKLGPEETLYRFNFILTTFLEAFLSKDHPLAICLENIQWADEFSLKFFEFFLSSVNRGYFLFIISYRDNEISPLHNFSVMLEHLRKISFYISTIKVKPLELSAITELIQDIFKTKPEEAALLAEIAHKKTQGNPFFLGRFLMLLYQKGYLVFDPIVGRWTSHIEEIKQLEISNNVAEILSQKIKTLEPKAQELLKVGAALGHTFDIDIAASLLNISSEEADKYMLIALEEELVSKDKKENGKVFYTFIHDRVQQSAYTLVKEEEKSKLHYIIAKKLLENTPNELLPDIVIDIVDHFNEGLIHVVDPEEKEQVSYYNFLAGEKAKDAAEFSRSLQYFHISLKLLDTHAWERNYNLCTKLYLGLGLSERMAGNKIYSETFFDTLISHARSQTDKSKFIAEEMILFMQELQYDKALKAGFESLKLSGYHFPEKVSKHRAILEYLKTNIMTIFWKEKDLLNLPPVENKEVEAVLNLLGVMVYNAYLIGDTMLSLFLILKMYQLTLKYGISEQGVLALALYSAGLSWIRIGKYELGFKLGQIALTLSKRYPNSFIAVQVPFQVYLYSNRWGNPLRSNIEPFIKIYRRELELGNVTYAGNSATIYLLYSLLSGLPLKKLIDDINILEIEVNKLQVISYTIPLKILRNFALTMQSKDFENADLPLKDLEEELIKVINRNVYERSDYLFNHFFFSSLRVILLYMCGRYEDCAAVGKHLTDQNTIFGNNPLWNSVFLYYSLSLCEIYRMRSQTLNLDSASQSPMEALRSEPGGSSPRGKRDEEDRLGEGAASPNSKFGTATSIYQKTKDKSLLKSIQYYLNLYKKWSQASSNYLHGYYLLEAEWARIKENKQLAISWYQKAIEAAHENEFIHEEALCYERLAYFYLSNEQNDKASDALKHAIHAYGRWDATGKVDALKKKFPDHLNFSSKEETGPTTTSIRTNVSDTIFASVDLVDFAALINASQAISKEIVLEKLVQTMMHIVIVNAGASKAFLILEKNGKLIIQAEVTSDQNLMVLQDKIPIEIKEKDLCIAAVHLVNRTHESIILNDAYHEGNFRSDPYIIKEKPASIAVIPLIQQTKLTGIIYLENTLTIGAFTEERLNFIQLLSTQMAIAIENARFYSELEYKINERTQELKIKNQELTKTLNLLQITQEQLVLQEKLKEREIVKNKLGRYVPNSQVLDLILNQEADLINIEKEVTILFCDIRDFTSISERLSPKDIVDLLNNFFNKMVEQVIKHQGILDKFIGDAFMAIFGATENDPLHALHAVKAALGMQQAIEQFNREQTELGKPSLKASVGINTGKVLIGNIGSNERIEYTAIGDTVNIASRVENLNKEFKSDILITESTKAQLDDSIKTIDKGIIPVKGKLQKVHIFEVSR